MGAVLGQWEPLPGGMYHGTMATADIYPTTAPGVIGGIRTQDRALPAFGEAAVTAHNNALGAGNIPSGLFSSPAGWAAIGILVLLALALRKDL